MPPWTPAEGMHVRLDVVAIAVLRSSDDFSCIVQTRSKGSGGAQVPDVVDRQAIIEQRAVSQHIACIEIADIERHLAPVVNLRWFSRPAYAEVGDAVGRAGRGIRDGRCLFGGLGLTDCR